MTRILVWGIGSVANKFLHQYPEIFEEYQIVAFIDSDESKIGTLYKGKQIIGEKEILKYSYDYICITSSYVIELKEKLEKSGIPKNKILTISKLYQKIKEEGQLSINFEYQDLIEHYSDNEDFYILQKHYTNYLKKFSQKEREKNFEHQFSMNVWLCWLQGEENAPQIVKRCIDSIREFFSDRTVILITESNMFDYVKIPEFILAKWKEGKISNTHFSDILRLELLIKYGGIWIDATIYCTKENKKSEYFSKHSLFLYSHTDKYRLIRSWFIIAESNNRLLRATRELLFQYHKEHDIIINYFIFHYFFHLSCNEFIEDWEKVYTLNVTLDWKQLLFERYNDKNWRYFLECTNLHKLTYKYPKELTDKKGTLYDKIINL